MEQSLFIEWVNRFFPGIVIRTVTTLNGTNLPLTYLHRQMLTTDFSVTGKWQSLSIANTAIAADIIAMDSEIPLKARPSISKASGDIPKMAMELWLNETQLTELDVLVAQNATDSQIVQRLFADTPRVIQGVYERLEAMFLQGLSTGIALVDDDTNVGTGIRVDYGYLPANKFASTTPYTGDGFDFFADFQPILDKALLDGNVIKYVLLPRAVFNAIAKSQSAKDLYAASVGVFTNNVPIPNFGQLNKAVQDQYGYQFQIIERAVRNQRDGNDHAFTPWAAGQCIALTSLQVGSLVYARLAEQNHPVENVTYETADDFILVSKYRKNGPLSEYTSSQARAVPVVNNVDQIYVFDATVQVDLVAPTISAGTDQTVTTATASLTGTATPAAGKTIKSIKWTKKSGPAGGNLTGTTTLTPTVAGMVTGAYVFEMVVTQSDGAVAADDVTINATVA